MGGYRQNGEGPWHGWLVCLLIGAAAALMCMVWLGRRAAPAAVPVYGAEAAGDPQPSLGFEFVLRFRLLLPESRGGRGQ